MSRKLTRQQAKAVAYEIAWQTLESQVGKGLVAVSADSDDDLDPLSDAMDEIIEALRKRAESMKQHIPANYEELTFDYLVREAQRTSPTP